MKINTRLNIIDFAFQMNEKYKNYFVENFNKKRTNWPLFY
ncbi:MAG: hypothetical protein RL185_1176 [Bacteroidota bacterium]